MARADRARQILFRIFYSTSFTIAFLLTVAFACAATIDALYQSYRRGRLVDVFMIAGVYVLTGVLATFLYASRLYTNRSIMKDIPKSYMPVDKYELPAKRVWRLIEDCKSRSAVIAYQARPRARRIEKELPHARERINTLLRPEHSKGDHIFEPQWGVISHPGWSSPAAVETPNLAYATVVTELTDLIEARAVSLAPTQSPRPMTTDTVSNPEAFVDPYILEALQRPEQIGMRQYFSQLINLSVLQDNSLSVAFLTLYERARFAPEPLSEDEFKSLMRMFAEILRTMRTVDVTRLEFPDEYDDLYDDDDSEIIPMSQNTKPQLMSNKVTNISTPSIPETASVTGSIRRRPSPPTRSDYVVGPPRLSEDYPRSISSNLGHDDSDENDTYTDANDDWAAVTSRPPFLRAPTSDSRKGTSRSRTRQLTTRAAGRSRSSRLSLARIRRRGSTDSRGTTASMRSARSQGSVIRLVDDDEHGNGEGRERRMFEFIVPDEQDSFTDFGPPRSGG